MHSWILDIHSGDLTLDGEKVARLSVSESCVLALLASHEGTLLSKDQLLDAGWPDKVVSPSSLTVAIKNIRKALSTRDTPTYIETLHRKGYIYHGEEAQFSIKEKKVIGNEQKRANLHDSAEGGTPTEVEQASINIDANNQSNDREDTSHSPLVGKAVTVGVAGRQPSHYGRIIGWSAFFIVYFFFLCLATFIFLSKKELVCYKVEQANICGRFKLDTPALNDIKFKLSDKSGDYLYGYTKNLDGIEIYQRH